MSFKVILNLLSMILLSLSLVCLKWQDLSKPTPPPKCILCLFWLIVMRHSKNMKPSSLVCRIECAITSCDLKLRKKLGGKEQKKKHEHFITKQGSHSNLKICWSCTLCSITWEKKRQKYALSCYFGGMSSYICSYSCQMRSSRVMRLHDGQLATVGWQFCW